MHNFVKNVKMHIFVKKGYGIPPEVDIKNSYTLHMIFFSNIFCLNLWKLFRMIFTNLGHFPKFEN
jgi:hypothetical protein